MDTNGNGYDIYDLYDIGEFDQKGTVPTKWGTRAELEDLVRDATALGVGVLWDAVLNHKAGADSVERFEGVRVDDDRIDSFTGREIEDGNPISISNEDPISAEDYKIFALKDNKAVVVSNIMYIVGQYPRFLKALR